MLDILHEDAALLVVNKPAGLVCHPSKNGELSSLVGRVRLYLRHAEGRLVNRLDRETSGVVVIAKDARAAREIGQLFAARRAAKTYTAIVHGHIARDALQIDAPIGKDDASAVAIKGVVRADGAPAVTDARVLGRFERQGARFSLVEVTPQSGRKHQIRIHLAHAGHAIVGDKIYGADEQRYLRFVMGGLTQDDRMALLIEHHALHAARLALTWRGRDWVWTAPLREDIATFAQI